jgi:transposase
MLTIEDLVPENHFLRKLEQLIDFSFIYEETKEFYCHNNGRPSIDPVILVKYLLVGFLYGIESERRLEQEIQVNVAYRWFLGLDLDERVPDHSTISQNRRRR